MNQQTQELKDIIEAAGFETRSYSGRGMFGDSCLAITVDRDSSDLSVFADIIDGAESEDVELICKAMRNARTDSMGLGSVIYFPRFEYSEETEDEA